MKENVSDFLVRRLSEWGVKRIFGFPGDGINGIMGALNRTSDNSTLSRCAMKKWPRSWPVPTPNSRVK